MQHNTWKSDVLTHLKGDLMAFVIRIIHFYKIVDVVFIEVNIIIFVISRLHNRIQTSTIEIAQLNSLCWESAKILGRYAYFDILTHCH